MALRQVLLTYKDANASLFGGRLSVPQLRWTSSSMIWGAWRGSERILELSLRLLERPWGELVEVLKHEMAHQFVEEVELGADKEGRWHRQGKRRTQ